MSSGERVIIVKLKKGGIGKYRSDEDSHVEGRPYGFFSSSSNITAVICWSTNQPVVQNRPPTHDWMVPSGNEAANLKLLFYGTKRNGP